MLKLVPVCYSANFSCFLQCLLLLKDVSNRSPTLRMPFFRWYSENFPICWLYLFWLTVTEIHIIKMRFYLLQFILNNQNVDCSGLHWSVIISASAFIILLSSNFLVLMTTWYFCKVPIYLGEFQLGSVIMGQQPSASPHVQIGWWCCLSGGSLACWPPTMKLEISWSPCYRSQWSLVMLWISVSLCWDCWFLP